MPISAGNTLQVISLGDESIKISAGSDLVYPNSTGATVTYYVDTNTVYTEEIESGESCLSPKTFAPAKAGWTFVGWRLDSVASADVIEELVMGDDPITLYAVFRQTVTLSYYPNGGTSGSVGPQTLPRYYNGSGSYLNPTFTVLSNSFIRPSYSFMRWRLGGISGTAYSPGNTIQLESNNTMYAEWTALAPLVVYEKPSDWFSNAPTTKNTAYVTVPSSVNVNYIPADGTYCVYGWANQGTNSGTVTVQVKTLGNYSKATIVIWFNESNGGNAHNASISGIITLGKVSITQNPQQYAFTVTTPGTFTITLESNKGSEGTYCQTNCCIKSITLS